MMAVLISLVLLIGSVEPDSVRVAYHHISCEESLNKFIADFESYEDDFLIPYKASAIMQQAEYTPYPWRKLKYFNEGKALLEKFIQDHPKHIEARYVRFLVQNSCPAFLGYSHNKEADIVFVKEHLAASPLSEPYKKLVITTLQEQIKNIDQ